jgi:hypothetical protein
MFLWNWWSFAGDDDRKNVNALVGKPYVIYQLGDGWTALYVPQSLSYYWDASPGNNLTIPVGGGFGKAFQFADREVNVQTQVFYFAARPDKAPEWQLRFTLEFPL